MQSALFEVPNDFISSRTDALPNEKCHDTRTRCLCQSPKKLLDEAREYKWAFICTNVPYDNNYFFESVENVVIVSFNNWNLLTNLPISNGAAYFMTSLIADRGSVQSHLENTGCINDFWWDKRGVDVGMRAAFLCEECTQAFSKDESLLADIHELLNLISHASRQSRDILRIQALPSGRDVFDVFLCHNSQDKPAVRTINRKLKAEGIQTWFDEEQLPLGMPWQPELERQIGSVRAAAVFVGASGVGPWQSAELRAFLNEFTNRGCPVIPVVLPDSPAVPELPLFLKQMTWLDLREDLTVGTSRLVHAIRGLATRGK